MNRECFVLLSVGVVLTACNSAPVASAARAPDGGTSPTAATAEEACQHEFRVEVERCAKEISPEEIGSLRTRHVANCVAELGLAGTTRTAADVEACASALEAQRCGTEPAILPECAPKPGTLAEGAACSVSAQCQAGACAYDDSTGGLASCGTCMTPLEDGDRCSRGSSICAPGSACLGTVEAPDLTRCKRVTYVEAESVCGGELFCRPGYVCVIGARAAPTCLPRFAPGEPCEEQAACREDSFCDRTANKCASRAKNGEACDSERPCAEGLGCDKTQKKCAPLTFASAGERCGGSVACAQGVCGQGTGALTCPQILEDGEACLEGAHKTCRAPARCFGGKCRMTATLACN